MRPVTSAASYWLHRTGQMWKWAGLHERVTSQVWSLMGGRWRSAPATSPATGPFLPLVCEPFFLILKLQSDRVPPDSDLGHFSIYALPLVISFRLMALNTYKLTTSELTPPASTSPPKSKLRSPAAPLTSPRGCLTGNPMSAALKPLSHSLH